MVSTKEAPHKPKDMESPKHPSTARRGLPRLVVFAVLILMSLFYSYGTVQLEKKEMLRTFPANVQRCQSANQSECASLLVDRDVPFLTLEDLKRNHGLAYSGMWWQNRTVFLTMNFDPLSNLEGASFLVFNRHEKRRGQSVAGGLRMTRDWTDLSVEHLSKFVKHLDWASGTKGGEDLTFLRKRTCDIIEDYISRVEPMAFVNTRPDLAVHSTIALLPYRTSGSKATGECNLNLLQLTATIASLWRVGIGRAIVVGVSDNERKHAAAAFASLQEKLNLQPIEVAYVQHDNATGAEMKNVPKLALQGLQHAMRGENRTAEEVQEWLGPDPLRWQHVYFSEPDLILKTRSTALSALSRALNQGKVLAAHRLEPLPHALDFAGNTKSGSFLNNSKNNNNNNNPFVLPDFANFSTIHTLHDTDVCCDGGNFFPANAANPTVPEKSRRDGKCPGIWPHCGFGRPGKNYSDPTVIAETHKRLFGYTFFRFEDGLGLPLVGANQRICIPRNGPATCG